MPRSKKYNPAMTRYLHEGLRFLRSSFEFPFYADLLQLRVENQRQALSYRIPLKKTWLAKIFTPETVPQELEAIHKVLAEALLWTNLGEAKFTSEVGEKGDFYPLHHPAHQSNWVLTGSVASEDGVLDTFKAAMVLSLTMQIGLAAVLDVRHVRYGGVGLPLTSEIGDAVASILQSAADPTLNTLKDISEHYVNSFCADCAHFRSSSSLPDTGNCEWAKASVPQFLNEPQHNGDPLWRVFVTHPRLQSGLYDEDERREATNQYRDRIAQWFDEEDQVTLDPITLHLVEDVLHAAKTEDELQDTDTVLPRALRLMDFWHSGYLPPSGESHPENPNLITALDRMPDALLPLVLSCLTVIPPQYLCIGFLENDSIETEVGSMQLGIKPLRDVLLQSIPRRVLELLASSMAHEGGEQVSLRFMHYLHEQASISFERLMLDYEGAPMSWLFEPMDFHLTDVLYLQARLNSFVHDVTLEAIRRIREPKTRKR